MIVPAQIPFSDVPVGGVNTTDAINFNMKCDTTTNVNLATGALNTAVVPTIPCTYLPSAKLMLG